MRKLFMSLIISGILLFHGVNALADDLYQVKINNSIDASHLKSTGVIAVVRLMDGFLVLVDSLSQQNLDASGLMTQKIASDISRGEIFVEISHGGKVQSSYPLLFENKGLRIYRIKMGAFTFSDLETSLFPLSEEEIDIEFPVSRCTFDSMQARLQKLPIPLESLIHLISEDSLRAYAEMFQSFYPAEVGKPGNALSRDWLISKLESFGLDSVLTDSFTAVTKTGTLPAWNVLGYKTGHRFPNHYVIVSAHRDPPPNSPGADDDGSGTIAVLEMARVLSGLETDMTIVFGLFDAEEVGTLGGAHCARDFRARGDSLVYMLEQDMIGELSNSNQVKLFCGPQMECANLWAYLADSLQNVECVFQEQTPSDQFPFYQAGYEANMAHEYIFSSVYHLPNDSISHLNFSYLTKIARISLAAAYTVNATAWPTATLSFDFPNSIPLVFPPSITSSLDIAIKPVSGSGIVPGSEKLLLSIDNGPYLSTPLEPKSDNLYSATFPASSCGKLFRFVIQADEVTSGTICDRDTANPHIAIAASRAQIIFQDNFETDQGWTVTSDCLQDLGMWQKGIPWGAGFYGEPLLDYDNSGQCYITGNRFYQYFHWVNRGSTSLSSPKFNLSGGNALVHSAVSYSNFANWNGYFPFEDKFMINVSNDENNVVWNNACSIGPRNRAQGGWNEYVFRIGDFAVPNENIRVQFVASDKNRSSAIEAAVDDFWVLRYECDPIDTCCQGTTGNIDIDGIVDISDLSALVSYLTGGGYVFPCQLAANIDRQELVDLNDLAILVSYLMGWGQVLPNCP